MADATQSTLDLPDAPPRPAQRLQQAFERLPSQQRIALLGGVALLIAIVVATLLWTRSPQYNVLFSGLNDQDAGAVLAALQQQNIPYKLEQGGSTIKIPPAQVHEVRLSLASQGLPRAGNVGFELLDQSRMGQTQFQEQVNYQRALEGELGRSVQALAAVRSARVHLAIPKPSIFLRDKQRPTASVLVDLYGGRQLDRSQVAGIIHLVSSSVPDLSPSAVSIIDQNGSLLSSQENTLGLDASQLDYLRTLETQYTHRIISLLSPIVGQPNLRAQVTIDLDFSREERTDEIYRPNATPEEASVRSRQTSSSREPAPLTQGGVPGSLSNTPPGQATAPILGNAATNPLTPAQQAEELLRNQFSTRDADTVNYELDKTVRYTREPVGRIKRVSAAVVVNHRVTEVDGRQQLVPLSEAEMAQIRALVTESIGLDTDRRDSVSVINIPFNDVDLGGEDLAFYKDPEFVSLAKDIGLWLLLALIVLYLIIGVIRPAVKQLTAPPPPQPEFDPLMPRAESSEDTGKPATEPLVDVKQFAAEKPQIVADVIRRWMNDTDPSTP